MKLPVPVLALLVAMPAAAQDRPFCADRPGLGAPACTLAPGRVMVETGIGEWTRDDTSDERTDTIVVAETFVRIGVTETLEAQVGWTPYGRQRVRDRATGAMDRIDGVGDVLVGAKLNLANPDGEGFSIAVQPGFTLPVGRSGIGAGDWSAALLVPLSYGLSGGLSLQATPQALATVDEDGSGRHLAWGSVVGLGLTITDSLAAGLEVQVMRDDDPGEATTQAFAGVSTAWQPGEDWQLDAGVNLGLNRASDDLQLYAGISRRF